MIEAGMFFALGLATAGLLALMVAPLVWRRAVRLTRARIEHAVPLTLAEIKADKDQLRAEFAMSARRLEMNVEHLRQKAAQQLAEIEEKRVTIQKLADEQVRRIAAVEKLEAHDSDLQLRLQKKQERLDEATAEMEALRIGLAERGRALEQLEITLSRAKEDGEEQRVELVARDTEIENLRDEIHTARARHTALDVERTRLETDLAEARATIAAEEQKVQGLDARIQRLEVERTERLADIDARDRELDKISSELADRTTAFDIIERKLADAEAAAAESQARISKLTLRLDEESRKVPAEEIQKLTAALEAERDQLLNEITVLREANEHLVAENSELQRLSGNDWEAERVENALLRERLNDIATEVARLSQSYRGDMGLAELASMAGRASEPPSGKPPPGDKPQQPARSLADRIRAMQRSARG
ncbi:MAG: hypothetical protein KIS96_13770 [Bauldia sp.]|nr:hypothetical protein [Bauldia sp.]